MAQNKLKSVVCPRGYDEDDPNSIRLAGPESAALFNPQRVALTYQYNLFRIIWSYLNILDEY